MEFVLTACVGVALHPEDGTEAEDLLKHATEAMVVAKLRGPDCRVLTACSAEEGLEQLALNKVQVIVSDQRMPMMSGIEFLGRVKELYPDTVRMVLSGYTDLQTVTEAVNRGAIYHFLTKPWEDEMLKEYIRTAFRHYHARNEGR